MNRNIFALTLLFAAAPAFSQTQDFGNRFLHASEASVGSQFLTFPIPMNNVLKGRWQLGVDAGYSSVDAEVLTQAGPMFSVGATYAFADHWGVYGMVFHNRMNLSGGGQDNLVTPFAPNSPLAFPAPAEFTNVQGTVKQTGMGTAIIWDPIVSSEDSPSLPIYAGMIFNTIQMDGARTDYRVLSGGSAGSQGQLIYDATYTFIMPMLGIQYSKNITAKWKIVPNAFLAVSLEDKPQKGRITRTAGGAAFDISGDTNQTGNADANFRVNVVALGTSFIYRPWGLGVNVGASAFKAALGSTIHDGVKSVVQFDLSWRFGNYAR